MKKVLMLCFAAVFFVGACAPYKMGTEVTAQQIGQVKAGQTTKDQVISLCGVPSEQRNNGDETWLIYNYSEISSFGPNKNQSTAFVFDKAGVLQRVIQDNKSSNTKNPLLQ